MKKFISFVSVLLGGLCACSQGNDLDPQAFEALLADGKVFLLDVRTADEYAREHIAGAANADCQAADFLQQVGQLCPVERPLAIYCRTGKRSTAAARMLAKAGYQVYNLAGGIEFWKASFKEVESTPDPDDEYAVDLLEMGATAPELVLNDLDGRPVRLGDFAGKTVVLEFWASWCPDCRADLPLVKAMQQAADPEKVAFVSVSFDRTLDELKAFVTENRLGGTLLFDPAGKKDSAVGAAYGVKWIPSYYVINPEGKVLLGTVVAQKVAQVLLGRSINGFSSTLGNLCSDESCLLEFE